MNCLATIPILASLLGSLSFPVPRAYFQAYKPPLEAKPGYVATGAVVQQNAQTLVLDTTPCEHAEKQIVIFHSPFGTKDAEPISCPDGKTFRRTTANQG
jgi:hypothetical protein